jgi:hypothetical protein
MDDIGFNFKSLKIILKYSAKIGIDLIYRKAFNGNQPLVVIKNDA